MKPTRTTSGVQFRWILSLVLAVGWLLQKNVAHGSSLAGNPAGVIGAGGAISTQLLYTTYNDIRLANVTIAANTTCSVEVLVRDLNEASAMDFYYDRGLVCFTEHNTETIQCAQMRPPQDQPQRTSSVNKTAVISHGLDKPEGLAIDWYTDKLYWTDGETNRIEVALLSGRFQKVLIWSDLDRLRAT